VVATETVGPMTVTRVPHGTMIATAVGTGTGIGIGGRVSPSSPHQPRPMWLRPVWLSTRQSSPRCSSPRSSRRP
jgi:hypothetical protein